MRVRRRLVNRIHRGNGEPFERELEDAYEALGQEREYERELVEGERKLTYYRVAIVVLVLLLLIVLLLWQGV